MTDILTDAWMDRMKVEEKEKWRDLKFLVGIFFFTLILVTSVCYFVPRLQAEAETERYRIFCERYDCTRQPTLLEVFVLLLLIKSQQHSHGGWHK